MAPAHRTRPSLTKSKQEPVAQRRATKPAPVTKNAEEVTMTIEEEQAAQEPPVSNMGVSHSRKRKGSDDEEQVAQEPPASNMGVSHSRKKEVGRQGAICLPGATITGNCLSTELPKLNDWIRWTRVPTS